MSGVIGYEPEMASGIVPRVTVFVMHFFFGKKIAAKLLLHHETVLTDVAILVRIRMVRALHENIAFALTSPTALPEIVALKRRAATALRFQTEATTRALDRGLRDTERLCYLTLRQHCLLNHSS